MLISLLIQFADGSLSALDFIKILVFLIVAVTVAMTIHEFSHALASYALGDSTAKYQGRLSLNPFRHMNLMGMLMLLIFGFGWANPVNIQASKFKHPRSGLMITAAAGPLSNFIMAFLFTGLYRLTYYMPADMAVLQYNLTMLIIYIVTLNITLGIFNLIPIPPLDGSKIVGELLPLKYRYKYYDLERYYFIILIGLILLLNYFNFIGFIESHIINLFDNIWNFIL